MSLFVFDLDDTLFEVNTFISKSTEGLLNKLIKQGNYIAFNSGRSYNGIHRFLKNIDQNNVFVVSFNGSKVSDYDGNILNKINISYKDYDYFLNKYSKYDLFIYCWDIEENVIAPYNDGKFITHEIESNKAKSFVKAHSFSCDIFKIVICGTKEQLDNLKFSEKEKQMYLIQRTRDCFYEIMNKDADKVKGVDFLKDFLKIESKDIYTFGDAENDKEMVRKYVGVAPIDAKESVKKVAKYIMDSAKSDGVFNFIKKHFDI